MQFRYPFPRAFAVLTTAATLLLAAPLAAQQVSATAEGNFAGPNNDGWFYRAELSRTQHDLVLRIWEGMTPDPAAMSLVVDNPSFSYTPGNGREWLMATQEGPLLLVTEENVEGYLYTSLSVITHIDNMIEVIWHGTWTNNLGDGEQPADVLACFTPDCWYCEADVQAGTSTWAGGGTRVEIPDEERNVSLWHSQSVYALGLCPDFE